MDVKDYNAKAWDLEVERGNCWTVAVSPEEVAAARQGSLRLKLTPQREVPADWLPAAKGLRVLCLASGGGQQGPLFAAAGAHVTVLDASPKQLAQDRMVATREGLALDTVEGDMRDLARFADASFDLVFHPVSNCFVPDVRPVWREARRVLRGGGLLLAGFINPVLYTLDQEALNTRRELIVKYKVPYSDLGSLSEAERARYTVYNAPLEWGHTLSEQLGGQMEAGFALTGLYEDVYGSEAVDAYFPAFIATRAVAR